MPAEWSDKVEFIRGSISNSPAAGKAVQGAKIIHLVAIVTDWEDEKKYWELTVEGSRLIFEQAVQNHARIILASSIVIYGDKIRTKSCPEETPYSRTKQAQEKLAWDYYKNKGMNWNTRRRFLMRKD